MEILKSLVGYLNHQSIHFDAALTIFEYATKDDSYPQYVGESEIYGHELTYNESFKDLMESIKSNDTLSANFCKKLPARVAGDIMNLEKVIQLETDPKIIQSKLDIIDSEINHFSRLIRKKQTLEPFTEVILKKIRERSFDYISRIYLDDSENYQSSITKNKIIWRETGISLANLFNDLCKGTKENPTVYISNDTNDIAKFIVDNFIDKNGEPYTLATITRYLGKGKPAKKHQDLAKNISRNDEN